MSYKVNDFSGGHGKSVLLVPCRPWTELQSSLWGEGSKGLNVGGGGEAED